MASNRHLGRILALQSLYEYDFRLEFVEGDENKPDLNDIIERNLERYKDTVDDQKFVYDLAGGTAKEVKKLDAELQPIAPDWPIEQIARVDKCILRMSLYELKNKKQKTPPKVVINEAVELAKAFGADNSSKFVNGVLGTAYRALQEGNPSKE